MDLVFGSQDPQGSACEEHLQNARTSSELMKLCQTVSIEFEKAGEKF